MARTEHAVLPHRVTALIDVWDCRTLCEQASKRHDPAHGMLGVQGRRGGVSTGIGDGRGDVLHHSRAHVDHAAWYEEDADHAVVLDPPFAGRVVAHREVPPVPSLEIHAPLSDDWFRARGNIKNGWSNQQVEDLIIRETSQANADERARTLDEIQNKLTEDLPSLPVLQGNQVVVTAKNIQGAKDTLGPSYRFNYSALSRTEM